MVEFKSLRILLYGESDRVGSGAWCYAETLKEIGHKVITFSEKQMLAKYYSSFGWKVIRKINNGVLEFDRKRHIDLLIRFIRINKPEIVIVLKGLNVDKKTILEIKNEGAWVTNINHDDFFSLNKNNWSECQREAIPYYDFIFVTRKVNVEELKPFNNNVEFFPFAYYPKIHCEIAIDSDDQIKWGSDISFIGTYEKQRAGLLANLVNQVQANYAIYGSQWEKVKKSSQLRNYLKFHEINLDEMAKVIRTSKISLGFLRKENRDEYTQRTFEIPACGGLLLAERTKAHQNYYKEGIEAEFFDPDNPTELINKVKFLLDDDIRRESIRKAGIDALQKQNHTYRDRIERLIEIYNNI